MLSAYFILAANSFMQNPVGFRLNPDTGRAELTDFGAVLTNKVALVTFPHTIAGAFLAAGALRRRRRALAPDPPAPTGATPPPSAPRSTFGAWTTLVAAAAVVVTGDIQGKIMTEVQPMKMAAAEALYDTESPPSFSIFTIGTLDGSRRVSRDQDPVPALVPGHRRPRRRGRRASTTCRPSTPPSTARATTRRSSRSPTGRSG